MSEKCCFTCCREITIMMNTSLESKSISDINIKCEKLLSFLVVPSDTAVYVSADFCCSFWRKELNEIVMQERNNLINNSSEKNIFHSAKDEQNKTVFVERHRIHIRDSLRLNESIFYCEDCEFTTLKLSEAFEHTSDREELSLLISRRTVESLVRIENTLEILNQLSKKKTKE